MLDPTDILTQGAIAGAIPHAWQYFQARTARRDQLEDRLYEQSKGVADRGKKDTDEVGVRWIRRLMTALFGINYLAILWLLLLFPQYSHGLMHKLPLNLNHRRKDNVRPHRYIDARRNSRSNSARMAVI